MSLQDDTIARLLGRRLGPGNGIADPQIIGSWRRCLEQYRLDPEGAHPRPRLSAGELNQLREPFDALLGEPGPALTQLRRAALEAGYHLLLTDAQGVVVASYQAADSSPELARKGMAPGSVWTEALVGTNGLGTCLATGQPITVYAGEHFDAGLYPFSCSTAPLFAGDGSLLGAIDISTYAQGSKARQQLALGLVQQTADELEAQLFRRHHADRLLVAVSNQPLVAATGPAPALLALDELGKVRGLTTCLLRLLSFGQRQSLLGQSVDDMLGVAFERLLAASRLQPCRLGLLNWFAWPETGAPAPGARARQPLVADGPLERAAGEDPGLLRQATICRRMVDRGISILVQGETGTGKEVWARALHDTSARRHQPFITLNCAAIPESLIESELFGYGAGSFTGALKGGKVGKIAASSGGTLFLDEIGDMPLALQSRLLRVLAEQEVTPIGQIEPVRVELNVICATHRELSELVESGQFREDLYYRISALKVLLPPLRQRQDKAGLIDRLLQSLAPAHHPGLSPAALSRLAEYPWPGNIRQLKSVLQYGLAMADEAPILPEHLPDELHHGIDQPADVSTPVPSRLAAQQQWQERELLQQVLEQHRWIITQAARALGISRATLHRKINKHRLLSPNKGGA
ncbi:sigma-54-dependent Fis family transcriptional regulator [Zobellella endophytica]|uniref:Sigma-54-dependent Fis family transcriptional regulator n=1 Tax=Zobellella endophytica TaxID=2116700 RepID=A0A2P7RCB5_9GAMM|nr:sigma-54-dependent Fis family transcriptional regulator [Zobellella endophytica]PSJ47861.1 sigma-54-dependent Fis family transcriptional regulator [Zobellella endophytica]